MGNDKYDKNRSHDHNGFLNASNVQKNQHHTQETGNSNLVVVEAQRKITEKRIHAGGNGEGDSQHIVNQKGAAGDNAGLFTQHMGGDDITAAAMRKMLNDSGVRVRDDENRKRRRQTQQNGQIRMGSKRAICLLGAVGRRRKPVSAKSYPRQNRNQRHFVKNIGIFYLLGRPNDRMQDFADEIFF